MLRLGLGCPHLLGFVSSTIFSLAELAGIELGVADRGMLLAYEEMVAEAGRDGRFLAIWTVWQVLSASIVAALIMLRAGHTNDGGHRWRLMASRASYTCGSFRLFSGLVLVSPDRMTSVDVYLRLAFLVRDTLMFGLAERRDMLSIVVEKLDIRLEILRIGLKRREIRHLSFFRPFPCSM